MSKAKVLVIEDEDDIRELIALHLGRDGYDVMLALDGEEGLEKLRADPAPDLVILDWMLPGMSGLEIAKAIRGGSRTERLPILMVTARTDSVDIVLGLEAGADDYVTKPFEVPVFLARARALLRRSRARAVAGAARSDQLKIGELTIDRAAHSVTCAGALLALTASEFKLLTALIDSRGRVLTRDQLIEQVQGAGVTVVDRAIDTHVFGLRKKLGPCSELIETVRGVGYRVKGE